MFEFEVIPKDRGATAYVCPFCPVYSCHHRKYPLGNERGVQPKMRVHYETGDLYEQADLQLPRLQMMMTGSLGEIYGRIVPAWVVHHLEKKQNRSHLPHYLVPSDVSPVH